MFELLRVLLEPEYKVVGTADDGQSLVSLALQLKPDVIISDIDMPVLNGIDAARRLRRLVPESKVIFMTSHDDPSHMAAAFAAGAVGYLVKGAHSDLMGTLRTMIDRLQAGVSAPQLQPEAQYHHAAS
jgi:DNA-binding NarL/FixJ family response regulator